MKNTRKVFGVIALAAIIVFSMTALSLTGCDEYLGVEDEKPYYTSDDIDALSNWLKRQPTNSASSAYTIKLKLNDLAPFYTIRHMFDERGKFVYLDLSESILTKIPSSAFSYCSALTGVTIGNSVTSIEYYAFEGCTSLTSVTIPNSVTSIGREAFSGCTSLSSITIPNSVTSIGYRAFEGCTSLIEIDVVNGNSAYTVENGVLYNKDKTLLHTYPAGKADTTFSIPNSITSIGERAFAYCRSLTSITIPDSVTSIGYEAFQYCTNLNITWYYNPALTAVSFSSYLKTVIISDGVTSIRDYAFSGCSRLTSVTIPNSVTSIGEGAFSSCSSLTSVTFEGTITDSNFHSDAFGYSYDGGYIGDLRDKYLAGGIGTYTRNGDGTYSSPYRWTKQ